MTSQPDVCPGCRQQFTRRKATRQIYCSTDCGHRHRRKKPDETHTCRACGIVWTRPATKGQPPRRCPDCRQQDVERVECQWCGTVTLGHRDGKYCGQDCYGAHTSVKAKDRSDIPWADCQGCGASFISPRIGRTPRYCTAECRQRHTPPKPRLFVEGPCAWCGTRFTILHQTQARYCSTRCNRAAQRQKRGDRFKLSPVRRLALYERDNWTCQLCHEPIDREAHYLDDWAPSLDHVICQSWELIPDHSDSNLQTAHRWCNAVRGDERYYTAADLAS